MDVKRLLRTGMVGGPAQVFTRNHEKDITRIKFHVYGEKDKLIKVVIGYDAYSLYLYCSGNALFQGNAGCVTYQKRIANFQRMF